LPDAMGAIIADELRAQGKMLRTKSG